MSRPDHDIAAGGGTSRRLFAFNGGFWTQPRLRRILALAGWRLTVGLPGPGDHIAVWGASPTAWRGRAVAARRGAQVVTVEDAFLRSILPGRARGAVARRGPVGLLIDPLGLHFDPDRPSRLTTLVPEGAAYQAAARDALARLRAADLSKYNAHLPDVAPPAPGYVLVIDQTRGDASLRGAGRALFAAMLAAARDENPGARIVIRSHPETTVGLRAGHYSRADLRAGDELCDGPVSPWALVEGADRVYAVSSQLGYEAVLAGHRVRLFGAPFYAGWGLTDDEDAPARGAATPEALFAASHLLAPVWYDPCRDALTDFEGALRQIEAEAQAWRQDHAGHVALGMRLWKRRHLARFFGAAKAVRFVRAPGPDVTLIWGSGAQADAAPQAARVEDGFLRSRGLGAALVPPLSLVADDLGIYYDPSRESRLEQLIAVGPPPGGEARAQALIAAIRAAGLSKYNLEGATDLPPRDGRARILVPGQVGDDASIRLGAAAVADNHALLARVRADNPDAMVIYKPHPDVVAGLREGAIDADRLADHVIAAGDPAALLDQVDAVWTITSTLGFEALLRGVPVVTLGAPFYAGWGLTRDLGTVPARRRARPGLAALVHACLIAYPRYLDPVTGLPCPAEIALERLVDPHLWRQRGALSKLQGAFASYSWLWRR